MVLDKVMKTFRLGLTDTFLPFAEQYLMNLLTQRYNVIRDDITPQILIFGDENFGTNNLNYDETRIFKVFLTGENRRFWKYKCHAAVTFDHDDTDYHYRLPLYVWDIWSMKNTQGFDDFIHEKLPPIEEKTSFCSFVVSNPYCQKRNDFFQKLSQYKKVDSAGPVLNNIGYVIPRPTKDKIDFCKTRKFALTFENGSHPGYVTEKIVHAFWSRSVPIYWGSPTVEVDFNPKAFLNWHDYKDDEKFIQKIIEVDNNDELYYSMLNEPAFVDNKPNKYMNTDMFLDWFEVNVIRKIGL
jgi:alpha(1,3/1,4) fucosyltransferase